MINGTLTLQPITGLPMIKPGDDLAALVYEQLTALGLTLQNGDMVALAQKVVSKSEGRLVNLLEVEPSQRAQEIAPLAGKDPRLVEVILRESREVIWVSPGIFVVETHQGYVCANAGVDRSNISQDVDPSRPGEWVCLLPVDSNASAARLRDRLRELSGANVAVLINDTHGRPFRHGNLGVALGSAGLVSVYDQRGESDLLGYTLQATFTATGDEIAAAASLVMGQAAESVPAVLLRGLPAHLLNPQPDTGATELLRPANRDVFRYPPGSERWRNQL